MTRLELFTALMSIFQSIYLSVHGALLLLLMAEIVAKMHCGSIILQIVYLLVHGLSLLLLMARYVALLHC